MLYALMGVGMNVLICKNVVAKAMASLRPLPIGPHIVILESGRERARQMDADISKSSDVIGILMYILSASKKQISGVLKLTNQFSY